MALHGDDHKGGGLKRSDRPSSKATRSKQKNRVLKKKGQQVKKGQVKKGKIRPGDIATAKRQAENRRKGPQRIDEQSPGSGKKNLAARRKSGEDLTGVRSKQFGKKVGQRVDRKGRKGGDRRKKFADSSPNTLGERRTRNRRGETPREAKARRNVPSRRDRKPSERGKGFKTTGPRAERRRLRRAERKSAARSTSKQQSTTRRAKRSDKQNKSQRTKSSSQQTTRRRSREDQ